jgi:hypothetical protein
VPRYRFPASLGPVVADWIEATCVHGPGDVYGQPVRLTDEERAFLVEAYAIDRNTGRRHVTTAVYSRRKGTRKSELGAWLVAAESVGPTRAYLEDGEAVARPPVDPWVICVATTENQGDLVYGAFRAIVKASPYLEPLFDVGLETTYLKGAPGRVDLMQSRNPAALDGGRPTFQVGDECHLWVGPTLEETFATLQRNLRKRHAAQPWMFLPTTAYAKSQGSVAERLHRAVDNVRGHRRRGGLLVDHREAAATWDLDDPVQLRQAVIEAGGDAYWSDVEGILEERVTSTDAAYRRFWLNQPAEDEKAATAFDAAAWASLADPQAARGERPVFAAVVAPDRSWSAVAAGWRRPDGATQVMLVDYERSTTWLEARVGELKAKWPSGRVVTLDEVTLDGADRLTGADLRRAEQWFDDALAAGSVRHGNEAALNAAVRGARWRKQGDGRVLVRDGDVEVSPLLAAALAGWQVATNAEEEGSPNLW